MVVDGHFGLVAGGFQYRTAQRQVVLITFEKRGEHSLRGVPGTWRLYAAR